MGRGDEIKALPEKQVPGFPFGQFRIFAMATVAMVIVAIGAFILWNEVLPFIAASRAIGDYEDACYARNGERIFRLVYERAPFRRLIEERGPEMLFDEFEKFYPGFKIRGIWHGFATLPGEDIRLEVIHVKLAKIAKKDDKARLFTGIELGKIAGEWKVLEYYFPDFINY